MRAARFYGPGDIRIEDIPEPMPKEGQVKGSPCANIKVFISPLILITLRLF